MSKLYTRWTAEEKSVIETAVKKKWQAKTAAKRLPGRTIDSIMQQMYNEKIRLETDAIAAREAETAENAEVVAPKPPEKDRHTHIFGGAWFEDYDIKEKCGAIPKPDKAHYFPTQSSDEQV